MLIPRIDDYGLRISSFKYLAECEYMFYLAQLWETQQTEAMRSGKLFESYVFGFREGEQGLLEGRKKESTLNQIKEKAENIKRYLKDGESWGRLETTVNGKKVSGEPDFVGYVEVNGQTFEAIADLKNTGDIFKLWDNLSSRFDYIQSIGYNWLRWRSGLSILPFVYLVNESNDSDTIVRPIIISVTEKDVLWFESLVEKYTRPILLDFNGDRCKGRTYKEGKCNYCSKCPLGMSLLTDTVEINFSELSDPLDIKINEQFKFDQVKQKKSKIYDPKMDQDTEIQESDIDGLISSEMGNAREMTYYPEEFKDNESIICRGCFKKTLTKGADKCQNCGIKIKTI